MSTRPEVGPADPEELDATFETDELSFGDRMPGHVREAIKSETPLDRVVTSRDLSDAGAVVGMAASIPASMTLPGPVVAPVSAVTGVGVRPTHRREGRMRAMMRYQLDDFHSRGEHLAVLRSSESRIYQRFGYGPATLAVRYTISGRKTSVVWPDSMRRATVRFVDRETAARTFPALLADAQARRPGEVSRFEVEWGEVLGRPSGEEQRDRFFVTCYEDGEATGYSAYRIVDDPSGPYRRAIEVHDLCATTTSAYLSLFDFLLGVDLIDEVRLASRPVDEPVRWALDDYRRMTVSRSGENTYVRLVDVGAALGMRRYDSQGSLVLAVRDSFCPWNDRSYRLVVSEAPGGEATVETLAGPREKTAGGADLGLDVAVLGSIYLGGLGPSALSEVGLVVEHTPGALELADRMFLGTRPPSCSTRF